MRRSCPQPHSAPLSRTLRSTFRPLTHANDCSARFRSGAGISVACAAATLAGVPPTSCAARGGSFVAQSPTRAHSPAVKMPSPDKLAL